MYELSAEYEGKHDPKKLEELGNLITSLDAGDSIVVAKSFSHMLNLANLAEEVQIAHSRRKVILLMKTMPPLNQILKKLSRNLLGI